MPLRARVVIVAALAFVASSCSRNTTEPTRVILAPAENQPFEVGEPASNQIAVVSAGGGIVVMNADGTNAITISEEANGQALEPSWSPDGRRLAWTELTLGVLATSSLITANTDGTNVVRTRTDFPSFYTAWDPTSTRVAFLGEDNLGLSIGIAEVGNGAGRATMLRQASPLYFSWGPQGESVAARIDNSLAILGIGGEAEVISDALGTFQAPTWTRDGQTLLHSETTDSGSDLLVLTDVSGKVVTEIVAYSGLAWFVIDPTGQRLALQVADPDTLEASVEVIDLATGESMTAAPRGAAAFFWSPSGERLLMLGAVTVEGEELLIWEVWQDGDIVARTDPFNMSRLLLGSYIPVFDLYAQTHSFWSPDSNSFTWSAEEEGAPTGVFVHDIGTGTTTRIADGLAAIWSPT